MHFEDRNQFIHSLNRYSLLIIDDLGIERNSDFALEQVFNVIDSRYRSKKPLIITTNLTLSELNNAADIAHKRIYDRILERCVPIRINNRNIRQDNATANLKKTKKILLDNHTSNQSWNKAASHNNYFSLTVVLLSFLIYHQRHATVSYLKL